MSLEAFRNRIETIRDPEVVNQWLAKMKKTTRYTWKSGIKHAPAAAAAAVESKPADAGAPVPAAIEATAAPADAPADPATDAPAESPPVEAAAPAPAPAEPSKPVIPTFDTLEDA